MGERQEDLQTGRVRGIGLSAQRRPLMGILGRFKHKSIGVEAHPSGTQLICCGDESRSAIVSIASHDVTKTPIPRRLPRVRAPILALATLCTISAPAFAEEPVPEDRIVYRNLTVARLNPLGLLEFLDVGYQHRLFASKNPLFKDNFASLGARLLLSPAFARMAAVLRVQPLSIMQFFAEYELGGHFGTFNFLQSFPTANADYSDTAIDNRSDQGYATTGSQIAVGGKLQVKVGPIAARSTARFVRPDYDLEDGDQLFYDVTYDILMPDRGWTMNKDTDVLYVSDFGLVAGLRWTMTKAFIKPSHFVPYSGDTEGGPGTQHRLGPFFAYQFYDKPGAAFNKPTALLIVNWWLQHQYRTGQDVSQAFPMIILGFIFSGDLWSSGKKS